MNSLRNAKETFISLNVDLNDKDKLVEMLQKKIEEERSSLASIEVEISREFSTKLEVS